MTPYPLLGDRYPNGMPDGLVITAVVATLDLNGIGCCTATSNPPTIANLIRTIVESCWPTSDRRLGLIQADRHNMT